jgi:hypothetical protein
VLLQSLSEIQKHMQQVPSNAELHHSERIKTPSYAQNHGLVHSDVGKSSSRKRHRNSKKCRSSGSVSIESSSRKTTSIDLSSSGTDSSVHENKKRNNSHISLTE